MLQGRVKFYNPLKGYGFILESDHYESSGYGSNQHFFNIKHVINKLELAEGDLVEFLTEVNPRNNKMQATSVRLLERADGSGAPYDAATYGRAFFERDNGGGW